MKKYFLSPLGYCLDDSAVGSDWIVFLHAAFVDHRMFTSQFEFFAGKYNILAIDILGHGMSANVKKGESIDKMANYIDNIMKKHNIKKAHFVGVSLGSVFAQDFANHFEEKVQSMVCFGGYNINDFDKEKQKANSKAQMGLIFKALFSIKAFAEANKKIGAYTKEGQEQFYNLNLQFKKKSLMLLAKLQYLVNKFQNKERSYPLLVGCGEFDIPMELEIVNEWSQKENCPKIILQGAGHCANMDKPQEFNNVLKDFWESTGN